MKTIYRLFLTLVFLGALSLEASAQLNAWSVDNQSRDSIPTDKAVARLSFPKEFQLFKLNTQSLRQQLFSTVAPNSTVIVLPNADGNYEQFEVFEASNFEPALQAQFPEIRAYSGRGITDQYATLKLSISPQGIQTMVFRTDTQNEFIEPYSADHGTYAVFRSQRVRGKLPWTCSTDDKQTAASLDAHLPANGPQSNTGQIKTMRLAQSCNGEYSNFFGAFNAGQVALVLAAFNATLTRCNGCYEKDLAVHLNLIANTTAVIYYDPATDPYTNLGSWNSQLQATLTANIGEANYDIGHMFGASGGGGNAGCIGCVCVNGQKGSGITSPADNIPMGDNFDIDYVVHEVGHQMGANHTFSHSLEGSGQNKEVGSGITIMGYAGITSQDVAPHSIDIFHETSIQQIQVNLAGKTCPITTVMTANHTPVVAPVSNFTIPITTPFSLTGSATDPESDPLTYCWEQDDNATTSGANSVASPTKLTGPNWLSFSPTTSPTRFMPKLSTILAGLAVTPPLPGGDGAANIEALSSVSRTLNFRLTVRDNRPYVPSSTIGQTQFTNMTVTVSNTAGPFQVTSPNTNVSWAGGSSQIVTWDVSNTTLPPVSCANVKISLSTDGGQTFPTVLLASTPNDGTEAVTIPVGSSATARIKVEAVGNIFFDVSNTNFTITGPAATPSPTPTISPGITPTPPPTPTPSPTPSPTPTVTPTPSPCGPIVLSENFDGVTAPALPAGWTATFVNGDGDCTVGGALCAAGTNWASSATTPDTAPNDAFHNDPACVTDSNLDTPTFAIGFPTAQVTFRHNFITENTFDGGVLEVSSPNIAGGAFTDITNPAVGGNFVTGGYTGAISANFLSPILGRMAWTGTSAGGYITTIANLGPNVAGQSIKLRFRFASDCSVSSTGWRVDTISVRDGCGPTPTPSASPTPTPTPSPTITPVIPTPTPTPTPPAATPTPTLSPGLTPTPTPPTATPTPTPSTTPGAQAVNLSTRMNVQTGDNVGIGGFIIEGTAPKHVLLRAIVPAIAGLSGALADPVLELHGPAGFTTITNNNWHDDPAQAALIQATGLAPTNDLSAAIDATLPPGAYTGIVKGNGNTTGIGLIEIYDLSQGVLSKLGNISTRALVGTGNEILIAGFILGNNSGGTRIVLRGIGGSLSVLGVPNPLANPNLELRDSNAALMAQNDNWQDDQAQATELTNAGLAPTNTSESGIAITLGPGQYTALLTGVGNTTGVGVVEVYDRGP